ncbi:hypothetical protein CAI21_09365 [Alkalilimnicola ehrlichii]|uniref:hypothetical protein n=1 Tax=Alkalilimnicola ehrlichii TaxID=351052 RepID=UPI000E2F90F8|nr:hypothetical protein [Alkalilimnicola ehrlichii]RFA29284.1 hypothetical protein CAI21_09365 [Alkalilimnicola ehrlichii]
MRKALLVLLVMAFTLFGSVHAGNDLLILFESNAASESIGTTNNGRLVNGKRLPSSGPNFAPTLAWVR